MNKLFALVTPLTFTAGVIAGRLTAKPVPNALVALATVEAPAPQPSARELYDREVDDWNYSNPEHRKLRWADTDVGDVLSRIDKLGAAALNDPVLVDAKRANRKRENALTIIALVVAVVTTALAGLLIVGFGDIEGGLAVALLMPPIWIAAILLASSFRLGDKARWALRSALTVVASLYCVVYVNISFMAAITAIASVVVAATFDWLAPLAPRWTLSATDGVAAPRER